MAQYSDPPQDEGRPGSRDGHEDSSSEFIAPSAADLAPDAAAQESVAASGSFSDDLLELKNQIEEKLAQQSGALARENSVQSLEGDNIVGVGLSLLEAEDIQRGAAGLPGGPALAVFTVEPVERQRVEAEIASVAGTRALSTLPIRQITTGVVDAQSHRFRMRPAPCGISVGHFRVTAGTIGALCTGNSAPRNQRLMVLSNNHVLANSNDASLGDCICQPGTYDGGSCPQDQIAILERFTPINFASGAVNFVDCATGWAWPDRVRREFLYLSGGAPRFFRVVTTPAAPSVGMIVGKTGRTTQLTQGLVTAVNVSVNVNFGSGRIGHFRDQIAIRGRSGDFSAGGDSGSLVWHWAGGLSPVGLLFAGGGGTTFANRITRVLSALDVRLVV